MLNKNPNERLSIESILNHAWVTKDGQEVIHIDSVEQDKSEQGFGNIDRFLMAAQKGFGKTSKHLLPEKGDPLTKGL